MKKNLKKSKRKKKKEKMKLFLPLLVLVVIASVSCVEVEAEGPFLNLLDKATFGSFSRVSDWVQGLRSRLREGLSKLSQGDQRYRKLKEVVPAQPVPMRGWEFEVPPVMADMTVAAFSARAGQVQVKDRPEDRVDPTGARGRAVAAGEVALAVGWDWKDPFGSKAKAAEAERQRLAREAEARRLQEEQDRLRREAAERAAAADRLRALEDIVPESYSFFEKYPVCRVSDLDQAQCGSCWAWAAAISASYRYCQRAVDAGWQKLPANTLFVSPQSLVSCAPAEVSSKGGCKGGSSFEASKWIARRANPLHRCVRYVSGAGNEHKELCANEAALTCPKVGPFVQGLQALTNMVERYDTIADAAAREHAIKKAILRDGPVTISVRLPTVFMGYSGKGVFRKGDTDAWITAANTLPGEVVHSYHAMVVYGWGVTADGTKFWSLQQTWGKNTYPKRPEGLRDTLLWVRGEDNCYIESELVAGLKIKLPDTNMWLTAPANACEDFNPAARCIAPQECKAQGKSIKKGLCPGAAGCCV